MSVTAAGAVGAESAGALAAGGTEVRGEVLRQILRSKLFWVGTLILLIWIACAVLGNVIAPDDPNAQTLTAINQAPSGGHLFGTDQLGRDVLSRVILGARDILIITPLATLVGTVLGTVLGLIMGYYRGLVDEGLGRFVEAFLALPLVVIALVPIVALGRSNLTIIIVIGVAFTPLIARTVRAAVLVERDLDYIAAARLRGERALYIMFVEILPNVLAPILVEFTVRLGYAVFVVADLSFLGFGIQPPTPDWGSEIALNYGQLSAGFWWEILFDALAIATLVVAVNLISDSVESVLER